MRPSTSDEVRAMYDKTAGSYAEMMDAEINLPIYADLLGPLQEHIKNIQGPVVDTACGSGHMLAMFHEQFDQRRALVGVDLSPKMVEIAEEKLGPTARLVLGDMRDLSAIESNTAAAVLNFFALHHLNPTGIGQALGEWYRILKPGGRILLATWEGSGAVDYGDEADLVALRYRSDEIESYAGAAGFSVTRCVVEPVEEIPMDAVYLSGKKI